VSYYEGTLIRSGSISNALTPSAACRSCLREFDNNLDVVRSALQSLAPSLKWHAPRDQAAEPLRIRTAERLRRHFVMTSVGVHGTEDHVIVEHQSAVKPAEIEAKRSPRIGYAGQANDSAWRGYAEHLSNQRWYPGALHDDVGS